MAYIDFDHWNGAIIADEIKQQLSDSKTLMIIEKLKPTFSKDGNQFCFLYGDNLQEGVAGFGDTIWKAMQDFERNIFNQKAK